MTDELFNGDPNLESYYDLQNSLRDKVIKEINYLKQYNKLPA